MAFPASRRGIAALAAVVALCVPLAACGSDAGSEGTDTTAVPMSNEIEGLVRDTPINVGELTLPQVDPEGAETPFAFKAEPGNLLFVAFGYTNCPDVCPTTLFDIKKAKGKLGDDTDKVQVAFATIDPERDTAEVMNQYLGSFVTDGHPLRTMDMDALQTVQDGFGVSSSVVKQDDGSIEVAHSAKSFVVDDTGDIVVEWAFGTGADVMANDLRLLLEQQSN